MDNSSFVDIFQGNGNFSRDWYDVTLLQSRTLSAISLKGFQRWFHEGRKTSTGTILANNPELGIKCKRLIDDVYVLCFVVFQRLKDCRFSDKILDGVVFGSKLGLVVLVIYRNNLYRADLLGLATLAEWN
jgi:hypothetical protein